MHSEGSITQLLRQRYSAPEWAFLAQVKNRTGFGGQERYLDGLAMNLYPSRGLEVYGFEIKVSRSDWLHELKQPNKAEHTLCYCDKFWVVTPDEINGLSIIRDGELPPTWGWLVVKEDKIRVKVNAPSLTPKPLDRTFVGSILRNMDEQWVQVSELNHRVEARVGEIAANERGRADSQIASVKKTLDEKERLLREFYKSTGVPINDYNIGQIGRALQVLMDRTMLEDVLQKKKQLLASARQDSDRLQREIDELEKAKTAQIKPESA